MNSKQNVLYVNPLQQGLKPNQLTEIITGDYGVLYVNPLQQGLKLIEMLGNRPLQY